MMGISSLPGAQQNPGQAAMPQAIPAPQPKTPASEIAQYQGRPLPELIAAFQRRPSGPLLGILTKEIEAEKQREREKQQRAMNAYAQQGPQTVADMKFTEAVGMLQPQMARHGGVMHGYSGGGAVALQSGGPTTGFAPTYTAMRAAGIDLSPYDSEEVRADKFRRFEEYKRTGVVPPPAQRESEDRLPGASPEEVSGQSVAPKGLPAGLKSLISNPFDVARLVAPWSAGILPGSPKALKEKVFGDRPSYYAEELYGKPRDRNAGIPGVAMQIDPKNPLAIPSLEAALKNPNLPRVERLALQDTLAGLYAARAEAPEGTGAPSGSSPYMMPTSAPQGAGSPGIAALPTAAPTAAPTATASQGISSTLPSDIEAAVKGRITQLEGTRALPPELLAAQKGLAGLEASNIAAQRAATEAFGKESTETLEAARRARGASRLDDIQYIGQMLEGMRGAKRLGEGLAGAASGAGRAEAARAAALKEAEKERRADQRLIRAEEAAGRQLQILAAQRNVAEQRGEFDRVAKIDAEIAQVRLGLANAKQAQVEKAAEFGLKQTDTESRRIAAEAAKANAGVRQAGAGAGADPRKVFDTIVDNVQKQYDAWSKSIEGVRATAAQKDAKRREMLQEQVKIATAAGVQGLEPLLAATAAPAPAQSDPLGIRKP